MNNCAEGPKMFRQGDVLIFKLEGAEADAARKKIAEGKLATVERDNGNVVLAYGENTGHSHHIPASTCNLYLDDASLLSDTDAMGLISRTGGGRVERPEPDRLLAVEAPVVLQHQEHDPITLEAAVYKVRRQREYDPEGIRAIAD
jgi:hypothetical protein